MLNHQFNCLKRGGKRRIFKKFMLKSAIFSFFRKEKESVFLSSKTFVYFVFFAFCSILPVNGQTAAPTPPSPANPAPAVSEKAQEEPKKQEKQEKPASFDPKNPTAEQIAELVVAVYGGGAGRTILDPIRKTMVERGKLTINNPDGSVEKVSYEKRVLRGETADKERVRYDRESPSTKYALIYNDKKVVGIFNETVFTPREDASKSLQNQIWHDIDALLRYKENGSTVKLDGREKYMGVEYFIIELTDKENRKTRYFVSTKQFKVMWLEFSEDGVNYQRRFYDYRYAQNTLVPYKSVLFADKKQIEETQILTVTYGQKVEEGIFIAG